VENDEQREGGGQQPERDVVHARNAMSGAPIINGTIQFAEPPIIAGITMKEDHDQAVRGNEHVVGWLS